MMLNLYNTLTRKKESFVPLNESDVRIYCCGPTVYDSVHLGNCRAFVSFDLLVRMLRHLYPKVSAVRNITDIDDRIIARIKETGEAVSDLTERMTAAFHDDMAALNVLPPDHEPRATDYIAEMQVMIQTLVACGHAYEAEGHVLFETATAPDYGQLSRRDRSGQIEGARVEVAPYKRDPSDFVLWKPSDLETIGWDSPWGRGRPGWHIECSAMSKSLLGETFDIHAGGLDLIFPHHENEIAQSACCHGSVQAQYWIHNGFLMANGEKMSKSLGNFHTAKSLMAGDNGPAVRGETIRAVLLSTHYRAPLDFTESGVTQAQSALDKWYGVLRDAEIDDAPDTQPPDSVLEALCDDLNTAQAFTALHRLAADARRSKNDREFQQLALGLRAGGRLMGMLETPAQQWFQSLDTQQSKSSILSEQEIATAIEARNAARHARDFALADQIRAELDSAGIVLEDRPTGTIWRRST